MEPTLPSANPAAVMQRAVSLHQLGRLTEAAALYEALLEAFPAHPDLLTNLGNIELQQGNAEEGVRLLGLSVDVAPDQPAALSNRGAGLRALGRPAEALACFDRAIAIAPDFAAAHCNRGVALGDLQRWGEALASYDRALALDPDSAGAHHNRGMALVELNRWEEALASYDRALALKPDDAEAYYSRGAALQEMLATDAAMASYERALALQPGHARAYNNRGNILREAGRLAEALADYDRAVAFAPDLAEAHWNTSLVKLHLGDFEEGWRLYEWRWKAPLKGFVRNFPQPLWLGERPIAGKTLLIHAEQGLGDFIQFCRYAPLAEALGAQVLLEVPRSLVRLASTLSGSCTVVECGKPLPDFDLHCPVMSLPLAFRTTVANIPATVPYLFAHPGRRQAWRQRLGSKSRPRVGLVWSGSIGNRIDLNPRTKRNVPLHLLEPWQQLPVEFHVLQTDIRTDDADALSRCTQFRLHRADLKDFSETAALIAEMDLVISVCTSVAHLAGALGRPVWILLPFMPDCRWMLDRTDSPWYPTATLFRQANPGDWSPVISEVTRRLQMAASWT